MCPFMVQLVTFQCGRLSHKRSAADRVLQSVDVYLVCGCHLRHTDIQFIFTHWLTVNQCKYWYKNSVYHEPWYNDTCGVWSNVHLFAGAVDVLGADDHTIACQACTGGLPWHSEGGGTDLWDFQAGWRRDYWDNKKTHLELESGNIQISHECVDVFCVFLPVAWVPTNGVLGVRSCRAMTLTVYSVPGRRPLSTTLSRSPLGAACSSLSPSSELEYRTRYDVTVPSGLSQVIRMEVDSMSEKVRSLGRSIAAGKEEDW